jgi:hypothetical protein
LSFRCGTALASALCSLLPLLLAAAVAMPGCSTMPRGSADPIFYPLPPDRPRLQYLRMYSDARDLEGANPLITFLVGNDDRARRNIKKPAALASHDGVIYVCDPGWDGVLILDLKQQRFRIMGNSGRGMLRVPVALAIDEQGNKFVADSARKQVVQFDAQNQYVAEFGNPNELRAVGVAVDEEFVYVTNRDFHRVEVYDRETQQRVRTFGEFGSEPGQFNIAASLALDSRGHLFVTDVGNFRIQEFDTDGSLVSVFGFAGSGPGTFARPRGIALDRDGHLYTVDGGFQNVQIWDVSNQQALLAFGGPGVGPGEMYLPQGVHVSYDLVPYYAGLVDPEFELEYVVLVANNYGPSPVAVYGFVHPKDPSRYPEYQPAEAPAR